MTHCASNVRHARLVLRVVVFSTWAVLSPSRLAAETVATLVARDVPYGSQAPAKKTSGQTIDLYGPVAKCETLRPVVLYIHGGGWRRGDKAMVGEKPRAFVERGYLLASANYRLHESVSPREQAADVGAAVKWLHDHGREYGGDPETIFLMGHSAGAHLVALVSTDERLLQACGLDLSAVRGVVLLDGAGYDVPKQMAAATLPRSKQLFSAAFGDDPSAQREASPVEHVKPGKQYPPFLIFHVGQRQNSREQSELLATKLREAGGQARTIHDPDKNHMTLNRELGQPQDKPTGTIFEFLESVLGGR